MTKTDVTKDERIVYLYAFKDMKGGYQLALYHDLPPTPWQLRDLPEVMGKTRLTDGWQYKTLTEITEEHNRRLRENVQWWPDNTAPPPLSEADRAKAEQERIASDAMKRNTQ